jgi:hypothetical protein
MWLHMTLLFLLFQCYNEVISFIKTFSCIKCGGFDSSDKYWWLRLFIPFSSMLWVFLNWAHSSEMFLKINMEGIWRNTCVDFWEWSWLFLWEIWHLIITRKIWIYTGLGLLAFSFTLDYTLWIVCISCTAKPWEWSPLYLLSWKPCIFLREILDCIHKYCLFMEEK